MMISPLNVLLLGTARVEEEPVAPHSIWTLHQPFVSWLIATMKPKAMIGIGGDLPYANLARAATKHHLSIITFDHHRQVEPGQDEPAQSDASDLAHTPGYGIADGSVDLLHIDAAARDTIDVQEVLEWLPKLSDRGILLLHGTRSIAPAIREVWESLSGRWPAFEFVHGAGLGVLAIGSRPAEAVAWLTSPPAEYEAAVLSEHFTALGEALRARGARALELEALAQERDRLRMAISEQATQLAEKSDALAAAQRSNELLASELSEAEQRATTITTSTFWTMTAPLRRSAERLKLVLERIVGKRHLSDYADDEEPQVRRYGVARPAGGYGGWWLLSLNGQSSPSWQDCSIVSFRRNGQRLALALAEAPSRGQAKVIRIPNDVVDVMILCRGAETQELFDVLDISLRRLTKAQAMIAIMLGEPAQARLALAVWKTQGTRGAVGALFRPSLPVPVDNYQTWIARYDLLRSDEPDQIRRHVATLPIRPRFSIVVPVYETPELALKDMVASVREQIYDDWELCIADDGSKSPHVRQFLEEQAASDDRIKLVFREQNGNISACSNSALALASGDYVALLDHDDVLVPHALAIMADAIAANPTADILYSDEDKLDAEGRRYDPYFKPDFNRELLYGQNFINHLSVLRTAAIRAVGGFRLGFEGSQDYDLVLRLIAATHGPIVHVPHVLYHWRLYPGAETFSSTQTDRATQAARRAIGEQLAARGQNATVEAGIRGYHRVRRSIETWPRVSVIIPTRDHSDILATCLDGLLRHTDYPDLEIIIADNDSTDPKTFAFFEASESNGVKIVPCPGEFNYSKINNDAVKQASGDFLLFLNNDISMIESGWLKEMMSFMAEAQVGAVGAKLLYPDGTLQHGGVTLGILGVAGHTHIGAPGDFPGYFGQLGLARDVSCATAACLLVRRSVFDQIGGFDQKHLKVAFNDVDLCIRIRQLGYRIVWTPYASLVHHESKSRGSDTSGAKLHRFQQEVRYMRETWAEILDADPFWNPNLSLQSNNPDIAFPPRRRRPWQKVI